MNLFCLCLATLSIYSAFIYIHSSGSSIACVCLGMNAFHDSCASVQSCPDTGDGHPSFAFLSKKGEISANPTLIGHFAVIGVLFRKCQRGRL